MSDYLQLIKDIIISHTGVGAEEIELESYFEDDLNIGSMELIEIFTALEEQLQIEITDEEREELFSVEDLLNLIHDKLD